MDRSHGPCAFGRGEGGEQGNHPGDSMLLGITHVAFFHHFSLAEIWVAGLFLWRGCSVETLSETKGTLSRCSRLSSSIGVTCQIDVRFPSSINS